MKAIYVRTTDEMLQGFLRKYEDAEPDDTERFGMLLALDELERLRKITDCVDIHRLRELVEADRDGKCVVLPCKVGSDFYDVRRFYKRSKIVKCEPVKMTVDHFTIGDAGIPIATACSDANEWGDYRPGDMMTFEAAEAEAALKGE